jgi:hypothetical protein
MRFVSPQPSGSQPTQKTSLDSTTLEFVGTVHFRHLLCLDCRASVLPVPLQVGHFFDTPMVSHSKQLSMANFLRLSPTNFFFSQDKAVRGRSPPYAKIVPPFGVRCSLLQMKTIFLPGMTMTGLAIMEGVTSSESPRHSGQ